MNISENPEYQGMVELASKRADEIWRLQEEIERLKKIVKDYYAHCGNNQQICGLNYRAEQALKGERNG